MKINDSPISTQGIIIIITNVTNSFIYESEIMMCKAMSGLIQGERKLD